MIKMITGAEVDCADKLKENYEIEEKCIYANVNSDKIKQIIIDFIERDNGPYFLIMEVPSNKDKEKDILEIKEDITIVKCLHKDIYYLDNMSSEMAKKIFEIFGELFINDGLLQFGFGNQSNGSEIMKNKYNVMTIYFGENMKKEYTQIFEKNNIKPIANLKTAWNFFSKNNPGYSKKFYTNDGKDIYDAIEVLKKEGLYLAEVREDV